MTAETHLYLGPCSSGKSAAAEAFLLDKRDSSNPAPIYVATLPPLYRFRSRIKRHQESRSEVWSVVELIHAGLSLDTFRHLEQIAADRTVLLDGLSGLIANQLSALIGDRDNVGVEDTRPISFYVTTLLDRLRSQAEELAVVTTLLRAKPSNTFESHFQRINRAAVSRIEAVASNVTHFKSGR